MLCLIFPLLLVKVSYLDNKLCTNPNRKPIRFGIPVILWYVQMMLSLRKNAREFWSIPTGHKGIGGLINRQTLSQNVEYLFQGHSETKSGS